MDFTKLSYQEILNLASILKTCSINLDMILNVELKELLNKIGDENFWSGTSAEELKERITTLESKLPSYNEKLNNLATKLELVVDNYKTVDEQVSKM